MRAVALAGFLMLDACAAASPRTWENFGVDSTVVTGVDSISEESALRLLQPAAQGAIGPLEFVWWGDDEARVWFRLAQPIRGRTGGHATFQRAVDGWVLFDIEFAVGRVVLGENVDAETARSLIEWARTSRDAGPPNELNGVNLEPDGRFKLVISYDGRNLDGEGCVFMADVYVTIDADGNIIQGDVVSGPRILN